MNIIKPEPDNHFRIKVQLTASDIITGSTIPLVIIPSPGIGRFIDVISAVSFYTPNSTPFDVGKDLIIQVGGSRQFVMYDTLQKTFVDGCKGVPFIGHTNAQEDAPVYIATDDDSSTGDGTANVYVEYAIRTL